MVLEQFLTHPQEGSGVVQLGSGTGSVALEQVQLGGFSLLVHISSTYQQYISAVHISSTYQHTALCILDTCTEHQWQYASARAGRRAGFGVVGFSPSRSRKPLAPGLASRRDAILSVFCRGTLSGTLTACLALTVTIIIAPHALLCLGCSVGRAQSSLLGVVLNSCVMSREVH